ncbi:MAG: hypothetical protein C4K48_08385 [Candidatus Thorarchaeota archaeon]|nr:MAG: hypothetical protein C4K48_08385 [Candidatus Thorarchaeota archaeon]
MTTYPTYDGNKVTERPVRLDKTEGNVIIEGRTYPARELIEALAQSGYAELRTVGDSIVLGNKRITPIFKSRQERAMAALCHSSLAYCCPLSKRCAERDRALEIMGLTPNEYEDLKKNEHFKYVETAKGIGAEDPQWTNQAPRDRIANRPAVDPGYGSEDYRRDFETLEKTMVPEENRFDGRDTTWRDSRDDRNTQQYRERESRDIYSDLQGAVPTEDERSRSVCSIKRDESVDGIGALFTQGELSPFLDDARKENQEQKFCFSCGRNIRAGSRVCPYCGSRL